MQQNRNVMNKLSAELFLKKILSGNYETIGFCRVFKVDNVADIAEVSRAPSVAVSADLEDFKRNLENDVPNVLISQNLLNQTLLRKLAEETSAEKNILWVND
ncbi:MAG: hypothetical protein IJ770_02030 [Alphaproteobacteria bacterium]|nr:hypothetical protein [Alphaproteobacteria bacterium]